MDKFLDNYPADFKQRNLAEFKSAANFLFLEQDLLCADLATLLADVDYVFHLAAQPGVRSSCGAEFTQYSENNILS